MEKSKLASAQKDCQKLKERKTMRIPDTMFGNLDVSFKNKKFEISNSQVIILKTSKEEIFVEELSKLYK